MGLIRVFKVWKSWEHPSKAERAKVAKAMAESAALGRLIDEAVEQNWRAEREELWRRGELQP